MARLARLAALAGGMLLVLTAALIVVGIVSDALKLSGEIGLVGLFEFAEMSTAIAVFLFLPYSAVSRAHVRVEFAVRWLRLDGLSSWVSTLLFAVLAGVLLWRMSIGFEALFALDYPQTTPILGIPMWIAGPPILFALALWGLNLGCALLEPLYASRRDPP